jgi:hypothetical protein
VWEIRVAAGAHPVSGRTLQRSVRFHGSEVDALTYRERRLNEATGIAG